MASHYNIDWLKEKLKVEAVKFILFWGHDNKYDEPVGKFCFSQWFESLFTVDSITYKTSEHWMMAQKALLFNDKICFDKIIHSSKPGEAKALGRQILNFDEQTWFNNRIRIVTIGNIHKFNQNPTLGEYLIKTDTRVIVEASPVDTIWGVGLSSDNPHIENVEKWRGLNLLGFSLMEVRDFLKKLDRLGETIENPEI